MRFELPDVALLLPKSRYLRLPATETGAEESSTGIIGMMGISG